MFHKVIGIIRRANQSGGLQAYMNSVQGGTKHAGPTYDEARKDYQGISHQEQA